MKDSVSIGVIMVIIGVLALPAYAEDSPGSTSLLKRAAEVDDPIPETYEPLNSTYVGKGEALDNSIEQSWQLQESANEPGPTEAPAGHSDSAERAELESRIHEPGLRTTLPAEPEVVDTGDSLRIRDE